MNIWWGISANLTWDISGKLGQNMRSWAKHEELGKTSGISNFIVTKLLSNTLLMGRAERKRVQ